MKLVADSKGRITSREYFPPGTAFEAVKDASTGRVTLVELVPKEETAPKVRLERKKGRTFLRSDRALTQQDVKRALEEFP